MDPETQLPPSPLAAPTYHGFWPVLLISLSLVLILGWEIWVGVLTRQSAQQLQEQQVRLVEQATQVQTRLEKLVRALVELGKTDEEAKRLVAKFGIKINQPAAPTSTPPP
jgi:cytochrome c-type biogenesis protein CcmH/NrfF